VVVPSSDWRAPAVESTALAPRYRELFAPQLQRLTIGTVLLLGCNAFEIIGAATAMPAVLDDLGGIDVYGWAVAASVMGSVLAAPFGGRLADRFGPLEPLIASLVLFAAGLALAASAPSMMLVAGGRFVQGLGGGAALTLQLVIIARYVPVRLRPLMLALVSAVFIIPGLLGPSISAVVASTIGWRWIFGAIIPLLGVCAILLLPEIIRRGGGHPDAVRPTEAGGGGPAGTTSGPWWGPPALAGGLMAMVIAGSAESHAWVPVAVAGAALAVIGARATMPVGTWRATTGLPSAVACALAVTLAYITAESFLPLLLKEVRGQTLFEAAFPLTIAAFFWSGGSWVQARLKPARRRPWARGGALGAAVGLAVAAALVFDGVPYWLAYPATAMASFGCGLVFTICQVTAIEWAARGQEGEAGGSVQLANLLGTAIGTSTTALLIAHLEDHLPVALGISLLGTTCAALVAAVATGRLPLGPPLS
jgi:MFS family permease